MSVIDGMPENVATADTFTGKKVIDREGIEYGKVKHVHINQNTLVVCGVTVHQGFKRDYYLGDDYIGGCPVNRNRTAANSLIWDTNRSILNT